MSGAGGDPYSARSAQLNSTCTTILHVLCTFAFALPVHYYVPSARGLASPQESLARRKSKGSAQALRFFYAALDEEADGAQGGRARVSADKASP